MSTSEKPHAVPVRPGARVDGEALLNWLSVHSPFNVGEITVLIENNTTPTPPQDPTPKE